MKLKRKQKITALWMSLKMWEWLAANPMSDKDDYYYYNNAHFEPLFQCWMCEVTQQQEECLIVWSANDEDFSNNVCGNTCMNPDSPYELWNQHRQRNEYERAQKEALRIVAFHKEALSQMITGDSYDTY